MTIRKQKIILIRKIDNNLDIQEKLIVGGIQEKDYQQE